MEKQESNIKGQENDIRELLQEACSLSILLEENLAQTQEERNTLYTVKALHRLLKEMQSVLHESAEGGEETF